MTNIERDRCRKIQDRIVAYAERQGFRDTDPIFWTLPTAMTVGNLRQYLYPNYVPEMITILREIDQ